MGFAIFIIGITAFFIFAEISDANYRKGRNRPYRPYVPTKRDENVFYSRPISYTPSEVIEVKYEKLEPPEPVKEPVEPKPKKTPQEYIDRGLRHINTTADRLIAFDNLKEERAGEYERELTERNDPNMAAKLQHFRQELDNAFKTNTGGEELLQ